MRGEAVTDWVVVWLMVTLDDVEREARAEQHDATPDHYGMERCGLAVSAALRHPDDDCTCGLGHRQAVVLAAVEADRAILDEHAPTEPSPYERAPAPTCTRCVVSMTGWQEDWSVQRYPCRTVLLVASRYRHRPGWRKEWMP